MVPGYSCYSAQERKSKYADNSYESFNKLSPKGTPFGKARAMAAAIAPNKGEMALINVRRLRRRRPPIGSWVNLPSSKDHDTRTGLETPKTGWYVDQCGRTSYHYEGDRQPPEVGGDRNRGCAYRILIAYTAALAA